MCVHNSRRREEGNLAETRQQVVRIDQTIKKGELNKVENLTKSFQRAIDGNGRLHLLGLVSDGGVVSIMIGLEIWPQG